MIEVQTIRQMASNETERGLRDNELQHLLNDGWHIEHITSTYDGETYYTRIILLIRGKLSGERPA